jgi:acyl-CoA thioester hydrolase
VKAPPPPSPLPRPAGVISAIEHRVNYSETDQMGLVYHGNYVIWLDMARTEHMRATGLTYKELEEQGVYLAVTDLRVRYRQPARYDDLLCIRCWVRDLASRRVTFGYAVERTATGELLATAETALIALDRRHSLTRIPEHVSDLLQSAPDPVRL